MTPSTPTHKDPRVRALLDALDQVLNSNTLLLCARIDPPASPEHLREQLTAWLHTAEFREQMLEQDRERDWYNFHTFGDEPHAVPRAGDFVPPGARLSGEVLSSEAAVAHLCGLLTSPLSFYQRQLDEAKAQHLVREAWAALAPGAAPMVLRLAPDFLHARAHDEVDDVDDVVVDPLESDMLRYFDGFEFDGALVVAAGTTAWMLLTNGSD